MSTPARVMALFVVSSTTPTDCAVALGASSTGLTTTVKLPTAVVSTPVTVFSTLVTPPLSFTDTVSVAWPTALGAGTKLSAPLASTVGTPTNKFVPPVKLTLLRATV